MIKLAEVPIAVREGGFFFALCKQRHTRNPFYFRGNITASACAAFLFLGRGEDMAKSKWSQVKDRLVEIEAWLKKGLSEKQVCQNLGVGKTTWESYKKQHSELSDTIKRGRESQVEEVENSLYKNATGFYYYVQESVKVKNADGSESVEVVTLKKFKAPETGAIAFFLKNKDKKNWADNPNMIDIKREELEIRRSESQFKAW